MKFFALLSAAAAVKVASKAKSAHKNRKVLALQAHADVEQGGACVDWDDLGETDIGGDGCGWYADNSEDCGMWDDADFSANAYCCACGGGMPDWYNPSNW